MKAKFFLLAVISAFLFNSCSSDDSSSASIVGVWKFSKDGFIVNRQEVLIPYEHAPGCGKDNTEFKADGSAVDTYYTSECQAVPDVGTYTKQGNTLTVNFSSGSHTYTILKLTSALLKVKNTDDYVIEFTK